MSRKRFLAWAMVLFAVLTTPAALLWFAKDEPPFLVVLCELGLLIPAIDALWHAEELEEDDQC